MTDQVLDVTDFVVIERSALRGVAPAITFYASRADARTYMDTRRGMFEHVDLCRVLTRVSTTLVPQEVVEGDPL